MKYAQNHAVKGRSFESLAAQNLFLAEWEKNVADTRLHGPTRQQVGKRFSEVEKLALRALPAMVFPVFQEARRTVHRDGFVEIQRAYYSVPPEYVGRTFWLRHEARILGIYNQRQLERRTKAADFRALKTLEDFDWQFNWRITAYRNASHHTPPNKSPSNVPAEKFTSRR